MSMLRTIPIQFTTLNTQLKQSFVIFVCTFDPFHIGRHVYTVENRCVEDTNLLLNDATQKIILNQREFLTRQQLMYPLIIIDDDVLSFPTERL